jgi:Family of unknown function (DUF6011)
MLFENPQDVRTFVLGGNALFTIESTATGTRFTFKVVASTDESAADMQANVDWGTRRKTRGVFFVSLLRGPDNESDYQYLGIIPKDDPMSFRLTAKSRAGEDAPSVKAFKWFWRQVSQGRLPALVQVWHEGRCGRCGRTLTVPESIASGFGPECRQYV